MGGQMYFIVTPTRIRNTIIWMIRVAVMLTLLPRKPLSEDERAGATGVGPVASTTSLLANYFAISCPAGPGTGWPS